jgi:hypothetical protein
MTTPGAPTCATCGAPDNGERVMCGYCRRPFSEEILRWAIPCPRCATKNRWGKQRCAACSSWIVVSCLFCGALSPHNQAACLSCKEAFSGAAERKAARAAAAEQQQFAGVANMLAPAAGGLLGALAGSLVGAGLSDAYEGHLHPSWDASNGDFGASGGDDPPIGFPSDAIGGNVDTGGFDESGSGGDS